MAAPCEWGLVPEHQTPLTTCPQLGTNLDGPVLTVTVDRQEVGGCELAMACDFVYCTRAAVFSQPEVTLFDDRDAMLAAAAATVRELAARSPVAVSICKSVLGDTAGLSTAAALDRERVGFRQAFLSTDRAEGMRAFLDKRAPVFDRGGSPVGRDHVG